MHTRMLEEKQKEEAMMFPPAQAILDKAKQLLEFKHDGSDGADMLWDVYVEELKKAIEAWERACGVV